LGHPADLNWFRVLAALLHDTLVVGVSQTAALNRRQTTNKQTAPPIFGRAAITLSIGPHSSFCMHFKTVLFLFDLYCCIDLGISISEVEW